MTFGVALAIVTFLLRNRFLFFTFSTIYFFNWFVFPLIAEFSNYGNPHQKQELDITYIIFPAIIFGTSYMAGALIIPLKHATVFRIDHRSQSSLRLVLICLTIGILLKYLSGSLFHSSVMKPLLEIPALYGLADKIYYLGVGFLIMVLLGPAPKTFAVFLFLSILIFFGSTGSRISVLIPLIFLILHRASGARVYEFFKITIVGVLFVCILVLLIGYYRIDTQDRIMSLVSMWNTISFRLNDFQWPLWLISDISNGIVAQKPELFWYNFTAIIPGLSNIVLGESIFGYDTHLMKMFGYGNNSMSVPMTLVGEAYLSFGYYGLILYGLITGCVIGMLDLVVRRYNTYAIVMAFMLFRPVLMLNTGTLADVLSLVTKDIIITILLFNFFVKIQRIKIL